MTTHTKAEVLLQAENISLCYQGQCILHDLNFTIRDIIRLGIKQGQVVSLIGRSGIGKTQLLKILAGLQKPTGGSITLLQRQGVRAGDMGVVFQNYYLFQWRKVRESLQMSARQNATLRGKEREAVEQYAADFDLSAHLDKYPGQLSGGQRQRASIIQQLLKGSDFLLLDEPFSGLDVCVLDKVVDLLLKVSLSDELKTLIIVSHDLATSVAISDTVFVLGTRPGNEGATICRQIDLIERDLAWQPDIRSRRDFQETLEEIKSCL